MNRKALSSSITSLELTFIHSMTTFCVKILTLFDYSNTDPYDRSVRNVASAGSLAEHSDPYGIDEAFSKVHTGVFLRRWNTQRRDGPVSVRKWSSGGMLAMNGIFFIVAILSQSVQHAHHGTLCLERIRPV